MLTSRLHSQHCEHVLALASRHIELKSTLKLVDQKGRATSEVMCVLFNDLILLAEVKAHANKKVCDDMTTPPFSSLSSHIISHSTVCSH